MTPLPKRRLSTQRKGKRRLHIGLPFIQIYKCKGCGADIQPHRVCMSCGQYKGKPVISIKNKKEKKEKSK